jgi:hypothetical protein
MELLSRRMCKTTMIFINSGQAVKVRKKVQEGYSWITLKTGEKIDLPEEVGFNYGFKIEDIKVVESTIGEVVVETKEIEEISKVEPTKEEIEAFKKELTLIKGIKKKTTKDIMTIYPTSKELIQDLKDKKNIPVRDDIEELLRGFYGKRLNN